MATHPPSTVCDTAGPWALVRVSLSASVSHTYPVLLLLPWLLLLGFLAGFSVFAQSSDVGGAEGLGVRLSSFLSPRFPWAFGAIHVLATLNYLPPVLGYPESDISQESRKDHVEKYSDFPPKLTLLSPLSRPACGTGHIVRRSAESPQHPTAASPVSSSFTCTQNRTASYPARQRQRHSLARTPTVSLHLASHPRPRPL